MSDPPPIFGSLHGWLEPFFSRALVFLPCSHLTDSICASAFFPPNLRQACPPPQPITWSISISCSFFFPLPLHPFLCITSFAVAPPILHHAVYSSHRQPPGYPAHDPCCRCRPRRRLYLGQCPSRPSCEWIDQVLRFATIMKLIFVIFSRRM